MTDIRIIDLEPLAGAAIEAPVRWGEVPQTVRPLFDRIYRAGALVPGHGHNFIHYANETREGATMYVGVLDRAPGGADPDVKPFHIPGGRVITATHWGDYGHMKSTYNAIHAEMTAKGLKRADRSMEIYADWFDDLSKVRTDLYVYLAVGI